MIIINKYTKWLNENKEKIYEIARKNTVYNAEGHAVIEKDDEWRNEGEWDDLYAGLIDACEEVKDIRAGKIKEKSWDEFKDEITKEK